ncbi:MAG: hypothetical protein QOF84_3134 [Streptomyces sp.]|nr:hypothetical protein [Streptomyces sp.]
MRGSSGGSCPDSVTPTRPRLLVPEAVQVANGMWWIPPAPGAPGRVLALDLQGRIRWQRTTTGPVLLLDGDRLVYCEGSRLVGLRAAT